MIVSAHHVLFIFICCLFTTCLISSAFGESPSGISFRATAPVGEPGNFSSTLYIGTVPVISLHNVSKEKLVQEMEALIGRLRLLFSPALTPKDFATVARKNDVLILLKGKPLYNVSSFQAAFHRKTPERLAADWTANLQKALKALSSWGPERASVLIPVGEKRQVKIEGVIKGEVQISGYDSSYVEVSYKPEFAILVFTGLSPGRTELWLEYQSIKKKVSVEVKKYAGYLPQELMVRVSGRPSSPPEIIERAIWTNLGSVISKEPGTVLTLAQVSPLKLNQLKEGETQNITIRAEIKGGGCIPVTRDIRVFLRNSFFEVREAEILCVSNNPEEITGEGVLFRGDLPPGRPARLLLHHKDGPGSEGRNFIIKLVNRGGSNLSVHIIHSLVGPSSDELYAGHKTTILYWKRLFQYIGWTVSIPAGRECILDTMKLKPGQVVSGLSLITPGEEGALQLVIEAWGGDPGALLVDDGSTRANGIFHETGITIEKTHTIGRGYTFIYLGGKPFIRESLTRQENTGNFGVLYTIVITVENPYGEEEEAEIVFKAGGGAARGIFLHEGELFETPLASSSQEISLFRYTLAPHEKKTLKMYTYPQSGSNYPVNIIVKSRLL